MDGRRNNKKKKTETKIGKRVSLPASTVSFLTDFLQIEFISI